MSSIVYQSLSRRRATSSPTSTSCAPPRRSDHPRRRRRRGRRARRRADARRRRRALRSPRHAGAASSPPTATRSRATTAPSSSTATATPTTSSRASCRWCKVASPARSAQTRLMMRTLSSAPFLRRCRRRWLRHARCPSSRPRKRAPSRPATRSPTRTPIPTPTTRRRRRSPPPTPSCRRRRRRGRDRARRAGQGARRVARLLLAARADRAALRARPLLTAGASSASSPVTTRFAGVDLQAGDVVTRVNGKPIEAARSVHGRVDRAAHRRRSSSSTSSATARRARCAGPSPTNDIISTAMIPYEELVAALDRYVARNGGTPQSARAPLPTCTPPAARRASTIAPTHERRAYAYDEHVDPDMRRHRSATGGDEDATHVGASPGAALPPPLSPRRRRSLERDRHRRRPRRRRSVALRPADVVVEVAGAALGLAQRDLRHRRRRRRSRARVARPPRRRAAHSALRRLRRTAVAAASPPAASRGQRATRSADASGAGALADLGRAAAVARRRRAVAAGRARRRRARALHGAVARRRRAERPRASSSAATCAPRFAAAIVAAKGAKLRSTTTARSTAPSSWRRSRATGRARSTAPRPAPPSRSSTATAPRPSPPTGPRLVAAEAHVLGVVGGHPDLLPELCALVVRGQLSLAAGDAVRRVSFAEAAAARAAYLADGGPLPIAAA